MYGGGAGDATSPKEHHIRLKFIEIPTPETPKDITDAAENAASPKESHMQMGVIETPTSETQRDLTDGGETRLIRKNRIFRREI